jgi:hypothetical protein
VADRVSESQTAVLLAVLSLEYPTVRSVAMNCGRSVAVTWSHLDRLRSKGLVTWVPGMAGTLRATVYPVPFGRAA